MEKRVKIMGILNVTPDSFSDGGKFLDPDSAFVRAQQMIAEGADIIDIGGESSGPGSVDISLEEEFRRVIPVIKKLSVISCQLSVDTYKSEVARQAIASGASMINDVTALRGDPRMARVVAETGARIVLMYSKDPTARTTRLKKRYRDVVKTILEFLEERIKFVLSQGIKRDQIIIDPGMGAFVSTDPKYSFEILAQLTKFKRLEFPILVGTSRKSFLPGKIEERLEPTLAANLLAIQNGADIIRVHDIASHARLLKTIDYLPVSAN